MCSYLEPFWEAKLNGGGLVGLLKEISKLESPDCNVHVIDCCQAEKEEEQKALANLQPGQGKKKKEKKKNLFFRRGK